MSFKWPGAQQWAHWSDPDKEPGWGFQRTQPLCREPEVLSGTLFYSAGVLKCSLLTAGPALEGQNDVQWCDRTFVAAGAWLDVWDCSVCRYFIHEHSTLPLNPGLWNSERSRDRSLAIQQNT